MSPISFARRLLAHVAGHLLRPPDHAACRFAQETHLGLTEDDT